MKLCIYEAGSVIKNLHFEADFQKIPIKGKINTTVQLKCQKQKFN